MGEFDDLLGDVIAEVPAAPKNEYAVKPADPADAWYKQFFDDDKLVQFIAATVNVPFEGINDTIINKAYAAVLWRFREAALAGDIDRTRSLKIWLDWAQPRIDRNKSTEEPIQNDLAKAFLPRDVK